MAAAPILAVGFKLYGAETWFEAQVRRLEKDGRLKRIFAQARPRLEFWGLEVPRDDRGLIDAGALERAFRTSQSALDSLKLGMVARAHILGSAEGPSALMWALPWSMLLRADGSHVETHLMPLRGEAPMELQRGLDELIQRPWRALGRAGTRRWSLAVEPGPVDALVGIEIATANAPEMSEFGFEHEELEARRRCAVEHFSALGVEQAPQLLLVTSS